MLVVANERFYSLALTPKHFNLLYFLFGPKAAAALDILDKNLCVCIVAKPSNRRFCQVSAGKGQKEKYLCSQNYCLCADFEYSVLMKRNELFVRTDEISPNSARQSQMTTSLEHFSHSFFQCKHQLAFLLGEALDKCTLKEVADEDFDKQLKFTFEILKEKLHTQIQQKNFNK